MIAKNNEVKNNFNNLPLIAALLLLISGVFLFGWLKFENIAANNETMLASLANTAKADILGKPNIILIISDDHGWPFYGFMNHPFIKTPNIDKLANEGIAFVNGAATAPLCRPSLQSLLTGLYQKDIKKSGPAINLLESKLLPQYLNEAGYATLQTGKWWEGNPVKNNIFTEGRDGMSLTARREIGRQTMDPIYDFIKKYHLDPPQEEKKPFFVWYAPVMPHMPYTPPKEYSDLYSSQGIQSKYYGMITWFDSTIGGTAGFNGFNYPKGLIDFLEENNLRNNTLIVFMSDNGIGLPHSKAHFTENGMRTPIILNFPGVIPATGINNSLVSSIDILPTILEYAGIPIPDLPEAMSIKTLAESGGGAPWRKYIFGNWYEDGSRSVRTQQYKLYDKKAGLKETRLFDLLEDPQENHNLIISPAGRKTYQDLMDGYMAVLNEWWYNKINPPLE